MSKKPYIILSVIPVVGLLVFGIYTQIMNNDQLNTIGFSAKKTNPSPKACVDTETIKHNEFEDIIEGNNSHFLTILNLWYDLDKQDENISVRLNPRIKNVKKIGFNSRILSTLKQNDKIQLPIVNNEKHIISIKNINKITNKGLEIYGELNHKGKIYASTLSIREKSMFALLSTPSGDFDIRMANDKGYIYHSNQDQEDALESIVDLPSFLD